jgi:predicted lipid carrier protein YhbT
MTGWPFRDRTLRRRIDLPSLGGARRAAGRLARDAGADALMRLRRPVELGLTLAVRRLARARPDVFERLGAFRSSVFEFAPDELPIRFRLRPQAADAEVTVVRGAGGCDVRVRGRFATLLRLFDGSLDSDAAYFSRAIRVEGEVEAVMALHNAIEAAELDLADLAGPAAALVRPWLRFAAQGRPPQPCSGAA